MTKEIKVGGINIGGGGIFCLMAGPCVIENFETLFSIAGKLKNICLQEDIPFIFKASYDKANRSSPDSYRGPGIVEGMKMLAEIKKRLQLCLITDIHCISQIEKVAEHIDIMQIPAFLCRQTDLIVEAGKTGKPVNIKKGQFVSPYEIHNIINKMLSVNNENILITERGTTFGYNNLVTDFRSLPIIRGMGYPVVFDATHSVQQPGGLGKTSGGSREFVPYLAKAAVAVGCDGIFIETHSEPEKALSDGPNMLPVAELQQLISKLKKIHYASI